MTQQRHDQTASGAGKPVGADCAASCGCPLLREALTRAGAAPESTAQPLLLTQADVARLLNVSEWQVYGLHRMGRLRGKKIGRVLRWRRADVERFVAEL